MSDRLQSFMQATSLNRLPYLTSYFHLGYPWLILWVCAVHLTIGTGLLIRQQTESLLVISGFNRFIDLPVIDRHVLGAVLVVTALLAIGGILKEDHWKPRTCLLLLLGQYGLVLSATLSDLYVILTGQNPANGADVDRVVILVVLCYSMYAGVFHTLSILERFVIEPRRNRI